jgi:hypothetical protein
VVEQLTRIEKNIDNLSGEIRELKVEMKSELIEIKNLYQLLYNRINFSPSSNESFIMVRISSNF